MSDLKGTILQWIILASSTKRIRIASSIAVQSGQKIVDTEIGE